MADVSRLIQRRIELTKESLEDVDKSIRKLSGIGRDEWRPDGDQRRVSIGDRSGVDERRGPGGIGGRLGGPRRPGGRGRGQGRLGPGRVDTFQRLGIPMKRQATSSAFSRLGSRVLPRERDDSDDEEDTKKPTLQSSVVATAPVKTRQDIVQDQQKDKKGQARNKRMFGLLLGTLHKFKQEATDFEDKNVKRVEIEQKLEKKAEEEKTAVAKEKRELFNAKRAKEVEMQRLEDLMVLAREQEEWNKHTGALSNFIYTKAKPRIFYMPKTHTAETKKKLQETKEEMMDKIKKCQEDLNKQLEEVEKERNRRLERMAQRDQDQREEKENRARGDRRRRSSEGKGKDDAARHSSSHDRDKRRTEHRHRDSRSSEHKRRRTRSRSDDPHRKKSADGDDAKMEEGEKLPSGSLDTVKEEAADSTNSPAPTEGPSVEGPNTEGPTGEGPKLAEGSTVDQGAATGNGTVLTDKANLPEGAALGQTVGGETSAQEPETGKAGEYEGEVHDGKGGPETGPVEVRSAETIPGIGDDGKDPVPMESLENSGQSSLMQDMDLSSIQLPEGPGKPIPTLQGMSAQPLGREGTPGGDFQVGGMDEQLDYNEAME